MVVAQQQSHVEQRINLTVFQFDKAQTTRRNGRKKSELVCQGFCMDY